MNQTSSLFNFNNSKTINNEITNFIELCKNYANLSNKTSSLQHVYPRFLLEAFAPHSKELKNIRYEFHESGKIRPIGIKSVSPTEFSRRKDFYTVDVGNREYEKTLSYGAYDPYRAEKIFASIESAAAEMLKFRQLKTSYSDFFQKNPYNYPPNIADINHPNRAKEFLVSQQKRRVVISVFLAMQYLRTEHMYRIFIGINNSKKFYGKLGLKNFTGNSFGDFILYLLPIISKNFYSRAWHWEFSDNHFFVPERTPIAQLFVTDEKELNLVEAHINRARNISVGEEKVIFFPVGPQSAIVLLPKNSFNVFNDKVEFNSSRTFQYIVFTSLLLNFCIDLDGAEAKKTIKYLNIAMHPLANTENMLPTRPEEMGIISTLTINDVIPNYEYDLEELRKIFQPTVKFCNNTAEMFEAQKLAKSLWRNIMIE